MPFLLMFMLILACLPDEWERPPGWLGLSESNGLYAALTWTGALILLAVVAWVSQRLCREIRAHPEDRDSVLRRYQKWRVVHLFSLYSFFMVSLYLLGWGWTVRSWGPLDTNGVPQLFAGSELVLLSPFLASLVLSWFYYYDVDRALHETAAAPKANGLLSSRWTYVSFQARQNLALVCAPIGLLIIQKGLQRVFPEAFSETVFRLLVLGLVIGAFLGLPWILRLVLGLKPLPPGPIRDRLLGAGRRLKFRCANILLWNTHGNVANAMVAGLVPPIRYVLLTDRLVNELTPEELEAVFGHEVGHVKHRHMLYYLGFLMISVLVVGGLWHLGMTGLFGSDTQQVANPTWAPVPFVIGLGAYIFVVFGFLSRRCERQADIYGCRAVSCSRPDCTGHHDQTAISPEARDLCPTGILTFIGALEKVASVNGICRRKPGWLLSWQHSTIARRVDFLYRILAEPALEKRFQRTVMLVKWGLIVALIAGFLALGAALEWKEVPLM